MSMQTDGKIIEARQRRQIIRLEVPMLTVDIRDANEADQGKAAVEIHCDSDGFSELLQQ